MAIILSSLLIILNQEVRSIDIAWLSVNEQTL